MPDRFHSLKQPALCLGACLLLASLGCGLTAKQKATLADFSKSAATVGEAASTEMQAFRDQGIQANTQVLLLKGETTVPGLPKLSSLDRGYELSRVQPVIRAAGALAAYGKTLAALTSDTQTADLKKASTDLVQSLGQLPEAKEIPPEQLGAFGTVIQEVGGLWIEHKRQKAVVLLVEQFSPAVDKLCDRLIEDFSAGPTQAKGWVYLQLQLTNDRLEAAAYDHFLASTTYAQRGEALTAYQLTSTLRSHRDEICSRISGAALAMKKVNASLAASLRDSRPSSEDLKDLGERAKALESALEILLHR